MCNTGSSTRLADTQQVHYNDLQLAHFAGILMLLTVPMRLVASVLFVNIV